MNIRTEAMKVLIHKIAFTMALVSSVTPAGDFNADGYDDLLIGIYKRLPQTWYEAAYLYYGGPDFDTQADLVFIGDQPDQQWEPSCFALKACGLQDFNGDGYDDIAIGAPNMCIHEWWDGRIYIYFGSPEPDTTVDLMIDGEEFRDFLGDDLIAGDFNGDGLGDLFTYANGTWLLSRALIYTGNDPPDAEHDFLYDSAGIEDENIFGGSDLNNDGYDEFGWATYDSLYMFWGDNSLDGNPDIIISEICLALPGDISGDNIDDAVICGSNERLYLCEGGDSFDFEPDYYMWTFPPYFGSPSVINFNELEKKLLTDNSPTLSFIIYNTGVPFDSIPYAIYNYHQPRRRRPDISLNVEDINSDGLTEFTIVYAADTLQNRVFIYSMPQTDINDDYFDNIKPNEYGILSCYPNPFNTSTTINFSYIYDGNAEIAIYNLRGELVNKLKANKQKGVIWKADDLWGNDVSSGIYFIKASTPSQSFSTKAIYIK